MMLLDEGSEKTVETLHPKGKRETKVVRNGMAKGTAEEEVDRLWAGEDGAWSKLLPLKLRDFSDGAGMGRCRVRSKGFRNQRL